METLKKRVAELEADNSQMKVELAQKQKAKDTDEEEFKQNDAQIEHQREILRVKKALNEEHKNDVLDL